MNNDQPSLYIEPFVGGASVALHLMQNKFVDKVILMDLDPLVASFWETVFFDAQWLVDQIEKIEVSLEQWYQFKKGDPATTREKALKCLFLNRTSFSGLITSDAGPIGGKQQSSEYPIDCRFPRDTLVKRVRQAEALKDHVLHVWGCSWNEGVARIREMQRTKLLPTENVLFYCDPPFFYKANKLYRYYFDLPAHERLRDFLIGLSDHWILSYDSAEQVERLYKNAVSNGARKHHVELLYSTSVKPGSQPAKEVVLSNLPLLPTQTRLWHGGDGTSSLNGGDTSNG